MKNISQLLQEAKEMFAVYNTETNKLVKKGLTLSQAKSLNQKDLDYDYGDEAWVDDMIKAGK
jgi:hypothetical protein